MSIKKIVRYGLILITLALLVFGITKTAFNVKNGHNLLTDNELKQIENAILKTVSVEEFAKFVEETSYVTDAERYGWSIVQSGVFTYNSVNGATWRKPDGVNDALSGFPVTQVSHNDVMAYCKWSGRNIPTYNQYWELIKKDNRVVAENTDQFLNCETGNVLGNVWDITRSPDSFNTRLAGGSIFCNKTTCNGISRDRELIVDVETGNIHVGFSVIVGLGED